MIIDCHKFMVLEVKNKVSLHVKSCMIVVNDIKIQQ